MYLGDWLSRWAQIAPEKVALVDGSNGEELTYAAFNDRAARLAQVLKEECGVNKGDRVALISHNGPCVFETLFACAKLGAIFVPLNWRLAGPELVGIVNDCEAKTLVYGPNWICRANTIAERTTVEKTIVVDDKAHRDGDICLYPAIKESTPAATVQVEQEDIAMVLYTSGTTGKPKGVMISWRQMVFNCINTVLACDLSTEDVCLAFLPLFHTGGINCLAMPIFHRGGTVVLTPGFDAPEAVKIMRDRDVSITVAVPAMYQMLLDAGLGLEKLPHLKTLLCGGAPCPPVVIHRYLDLGYNFRQGYGLTEVGPNCFSLSPAHTSSKLGTVGMPIFHSEARLLKDDGSDATAGEVGELLLRGPHVTSGYWNNPEATAKVLDSEGWFHTGDYATVDEDGFYSIVGRKKEMFISGGENVYPAEVENVLAEHPGIQELAVVGVPHEKWGEVGMAVIVKKDEYKGEPMTDESLKLWTRERLAAYKVPKRWVFVSELPKNSSGKVQKHLLSA